jgi:hypothetical protein
MYHWSQRGVSQSQEREGEIMYNLFLKNVSYSSSLKVLNKGRSDLMYGLATSFVVVLLLVTVSRLGATTYDIRFEADLTGRNQAWVNLFSHAPNLIWGEFTISIDSTGVHGICSAITLECNDSNWSMQNWVAPGANWWFPFTGTVDVLNIYGNMNGIFTYPGAYDFQLRIDGFPDHPAFNSFWVSIGTEEGAGSVIICPIIYTGVGSLSVTAVPLPGALPLCGTGLICLAWARRRKRGGA